ncbi:MAG: DUF2179 domain-containing protein [Acidobacteriota bacterium]|jgi:uncharacterized protein YebE (UPF0316 family)|nr:DUF2179 domain-containing protein [Acidobacteriota bacterium]
MAELFMSSSLWTWFLMPLLIFFARVTDVTLGTMRIVFVTRGSRLWAPLLGFFEVLIWLLAMQQIFRNLDNWVCYVAYASGFATGNLVGLILENRIAVGRLAIRIVTRRDSRRLVRWFRDNDFGITLVDAKGSKGMVKIIYMIINRKDLNRVVEKIGHYNPRAFYTVEDVRVAQEGVFPSPFRLGRDRWRLRFLDRKGK